MTDALKNVNVSQVSTEKTLLIINVFIEIINVSSLLHQCFSKESSTIHR